MLLNGISGLAEFRRRLPTTDLYFLNAVKMLGYKARAIRLLGRHIYQIGSVAVISRYATLQELDALAGRGVSRVVYIADDDYAAGAIEEGLPLSYRERLESFLRVDWPAIKQVSDAVLVPSPALVDVYGKIAHRVDPLWHVPPADMAHFDRPAPFKLAFLGTRSHLSDLDVIVPALATILRERDDITLTLYLGDYAPRELLATGRVRPLAPLPWWRYKRAITRQRFHLAVYPLRPTRFNAARSANKLFEHAITGAASLMSPMIALENVPSADIDATIVDSSAAAWQERISAALADRLSLRDRAARLRESLLADASDGALLRFWRAILAFH